MGKRKAENPTTSSQHQAERQVGKGESSINHVHRNNEIREPQAQAQPQEPQLQQEEHSLTLK